MTAPRDAAPARDVDNLVSEARAVCRSRPGLERLRQLNDELRPRLRLSQAIVLNDMTEINRGTPEWHARDKAVDEATDLLASGLSPSPLAAELLVTHLGQSLGRLEAWARSGPLGEFCRRCTKPILPGERAESRALASTSGPPNFAGVHRDLCDCAGEDDGE